MRISFLYGLPLDLLVQRDRMHKSNESALITISSMEQELLEVKQAFEKSPIAENQQLSELLDMMFKMTDALKGYVSPSEEPKK